VVRNIGDRTIKFISARQHNVTPLDSIEVYTIGENIRLHDMFRVMDSQTEVPMPDIKKASKNDIEAYFATVFPELDEDRVYASDKKKMLKWYDLLKSCGLLVFEQAAENTEAVAEGEATLEATATVPESETDEARDEKAAE
jgi:hypothetical protein